MDPIVVFYISENLANELVFLISYKTRKTKLGDGLANSEVFLEKNNGKRSYRNYDLHGFYLIGIYFYQNGKLHGECKQWCRDKYIHTFYNNGKKDGFYKEYDLNGNLIIYDFYIDGFLV
jgi:antitoxin component YwqK of YwqJK toxin-antitoxin module